MLLKQSVQESPTSTKTTTFSKLQARQAPYLEKPGTLNPDQ